jgi:hypothetical protein
LIPPDQPANLLTRAFRTEMVNGGVDVALDYLWGPSAESLIAAAAGHAVITLAAEDMQKAELYGAAVIKDIAHLIYLRAVTKGMWSQLGKILRLAGSKAQRDDLTMGLARSARWYSMTYGRLDI